MSAPVAAPVGDVAPADPTPSVLFEPSMLGPISPGLAAMTPVEVADLLDNSPAEDGVLLDVPGPDPDRPDPADGPNPGDDVSGNPDAADPGPDDTADPNDNPGDGPGDAPNDDVGNPGDDTNGDDPDGGDPVDGDNPGDVGNEPETAPTPQLGDGDAPSPTAQLIPPAFADMTPTEIKALAPADFMDLVPDDNEEGDPDAPDNVPDDTGDPDGDSQVDPDNDEGGDQDGVDPDGDPDGGADPADDTETAPAQVAPNMLTPTATAQMTPTEVDPGLERSPALDGVGLGDPEEGIVDNNTDQGGADDQGADDQGADDAGATASAESPAYSPIVPDLDFLGTRAPDDTDAEKGILGGIEQEVADDLSGGAIAGVTIILIAFAVGLYIVRKRFRYGKMQFSSEPDNLASSAHRSGMV